jgi:hypothetical protein
LFVAATIVAAVYGLLAGNHTALQLAGLLAIASAFNLFPAYLNRR